MRRVIREVPPLASGMPSALGLFPANRSALDLKHGPEVDASGRGHLQWINAVATAVVDGRPVA